MQFSTKWKHTSTGYSHYGPRFYSTSLSRLINRDLIGEVGGMNLYGFVGNNPIGNMDAWEMKLSSVPTPQGISTSIELAQEGVVMSRPFVKLGRLLEEIDRIGVERCCLMSV